MTALPSAQPGLLSRLPLVGFIARDIGRDINIVFYLLTILVTALVLAIKTWGLVALAMTALAVVPVYFVLLILITRG
ncbi:hypothetical protein SAMN04488103_102556 [Gemmobacter aquatilis]|uniref:Uncharacterized protein n=1 Tax=Gemmobacter aquatilis TaxID=933059 RepID=A0A1H8CLR2_9RHOB|nr:hypothetical protein [Gemmobacter aquatilis]SEM95839.1 hypothetical protein SAMN04488103_102556 [Gemmobacter aquatilis]